MYTLRTDDGQTTTSDPRQAIALARARGHRLTTPHARTVPALPRLHLPGLTRKSDAWVRAQLCASIRKANERSGGHPQYTQHLGQADSAGWVLTATDGHRAIFARPTGPMHGVPVPAPPPPLPHPEMYTPGPQRIIVGADCAAVWRRMSVLASGWVDLTATGSTLTCAVQDEAGDTATETVTLDLPVEGTIRVRVNPAYLAPLFRRPPVTLAYSPRPEESATDPPLVCWCAGADWRYAVMGIRCRTSG